MGVDQLKIQDLCVETVRLIKGLPGRFSEGYKHPTFKERALFRHAVKAFIKEDWEVAAKRAKRVNYEVIKVHIEKVQHVIYGMIPRK